MYLREMHMVIYALLIYDLWVQELIIIKIKCMEACEKVARLNEHEWSLNFTHAAIYDTFIFEN